MTPDTPDGPLASAGFGKGEHSDPMVHLEHAVASAESAVRRNAERSRARDALSSEWYTEQDADLRFTYSAGTAGLESRSARAAIFGMTRRELPGIAWDPLRLTALEALESARLPFRRFEIEATADDGEPQYLSLSGEPAFDSAGTFTGYRGVAANIGTRFAADRAAAVHTLQQGLLAKFGRDAFVIKDIAALAQVAVTTVAAGLEVDAAALLRFSDEGQHMVMEAGSGWQGVLPNGASVYAVGGALDEFMSLRAEPMVIAPPHPGTGRSGSDFLAAHRVAAGIEARILSEGAPPAILGAYSTAPRTFSASSATFLRGIADILCVAAEQRKVEDNIAYLASYDALTDLANRSEFRDQLRLQLLAAERDATMIGVLYVDLDGFKSINDAQGHDCGDRLLVLVAERLRASVPENGVIARQGGDEFAVMVCNLTDRDHALLVAEHLCGELGRPFNLDGRETCITASIGVAIYPADGLDADTLVKNADTAMYQGKQQGRNNFRTYSVHLDAAAVKRRKLAVELHQAALQGEFELHYQPQVELKSGRVVGAEALLRWWHPAHGLLAAAEFISVAEESGLITQIGAWVLETTCRQMVEWQKNGFTDLYVSVNVSPLEVARGKLVEQVRRALAVSGLPARHLELELTQSGVSDDHETFSRTLRELDALGVSIAIDDFGSDSSGLRLLKNPAIDKIKIDQGFTRNVATDLDDSTIVQNIITMAHHMQIDVVAKGVETEEQARFLRRSRCDVAQGFLFGAPMQSSNFEELLSCEAAGLTDAFVSPVTAAPQFFPLASLDDAADVATGDGLRLL